MTIAHPEYARHVSRRAFMVGAAGLTFAVASALSRRRRDGRRRGQRRVTLSPWVTISTDDTVAIMSPAAEMGQGSLDLAAADPRRGARRRLGEGAHRRRAAERRALQESGVRLHVHRRQQCRDLVFQAAAPVRRAGPQGAAGERRQALGRAGRGADHRAERGDPREVRPPPRRYGEIAAFAEVPAQGAGGGGERAQEARNRFRLIGKDVMRVELPQKVNGTRAIRIDVQVPGMLYGAILRAPVEGAAPDKIDDAKAKAIAGRASRIVRAALRRRRDRRDAVGGVRRQGRAQGHLDAHRQGVGLQQRQGAGRVRRGGARHVAADQAVGQGGRCAGRAADGGERSSKPSIATISSITPRWSR